MPIDITPPDGPERLQNATNALPAALMEAARVELDATNQIVLGAVLAKHFTGQGPFAAADHRLGVVTNRLRSSMRTTLATVEEGGLSFQIGSNVEYFGAHEFGFQGAVAVAGHSRRITKNQSFKFGGAVTRRVTQKQDAFVRPHTRQLNIPERAPLRTGLEEAKGIYQRRLGAVMQRAIVVNIEKAWGN